MSGRPNVPERREVPCPINWQIPRQELKGNKPKRIDFRPDQALLDKVAAFLGLLELKHWRIKGDLRPAAHDGWRLKARMTAQLVQKCVITLEPVPETIDETISRVFVPEESADAETADDFDINAEDDPDAFGDLLDLGTAVLEELVLALEPYPRVEKADSAPVMAAPPGTEPLTDEAIRPFAELAALKEKMAGKNE